MEFHSTKYEPLEDGGVLHSKREFRLDNRENSAFSLLLQPRKNI